MSWSADIADAIIALDTALKNFERAFPDRNMQKLREWHALKNAITNMQEAAIGDEGQHFDSLEEARQFRAPRCWGTNSRVQNYSGKEEFHVPTCGSTKPHDPHFI